MSSSTTNHSGSQDSSCTLDTGKRKNGITFNAGNENALNFADTTRATGIQRSTENVMCRSIVVVTAR